MPLLEDCEYVDQTSFSGANEILDEEDVTEPQCLANRNSMFPEGAVTVRNGFGSAFNPNRAIRSLYNWIQQQYNRLMYLGDDGNLIAKDLSGSIADATVLTGVTANGMAFLQAGYRLFMAQFDATGYGNDQTKIWDGTFTSSTPNVDVAFQGTLKTTQLAGGANWAASSEPGVGVVSPGDHYFGLVPVTWNGFQTRPGPLDSITLAFVPVKITASGGKNLQIVVTPATTWPSSVNTLQLVMTTVQNPNRYFLVPSNFGGGPILIARGSSFAVTFTVNIDDTTLTSEATDITDTLFNLFTTDTLVVRPHYIFSYNNRAVYIIRTLGPDGLSKVTLILISDPSSPQTIVLALNSINLPEFRDALWGFSLGGVMFVGGPSWTYAYTDNRQSPVNWQPPRVVSNSIGSPFIRGISSNIDRGYAWVGDHSGLYYLTGGNYPILPTSYEQKPTWDRINFAAEANSFAIVDAPDIRSVIVMAALDGATKPTHLMVWDYTRGVDPGQVKYCGLWYIGGIANIGDVAIVQNYPTKIKELWLSRVDAVGKVYRMKSKEAGDASIYNDDGAGIDSSYKMLTVAAAAEGPVQHMGVRARLRGVGACNINAYPLDATIPIPMQPISAAEMSLAPGKRFFRSADVQSDCISYEFNNGAVADSYFILAAIRSYFIPWMPEE